MASLPTGSDKTELISIETDAFELVIKGKAEHPQFPGVTYSQKVAHFRCRYFGKRLTIFKKGLPVPVDSSNVDLSIEPLFFEQQDYVFYAKANNPDAVLNFYHANPHVRAGIDHPTPNDQNVLFGGLNFDNDIGFSDFILKIGDDAVLFFTLEVFPSKIDYFSDYQALMADVMAETYSLIFDFLKKTYRDFGVGHQAISSPAEFFAILKEIYDKFRLSVDIILSQPHHELIKEYDLRDSFKIRSTDRRCENWLVAHPEHVDQGPGDFYVDKCLEVRKRVTVDTRENRMTKFILASVLRKIREFRFDYLDYVMGKDPDISKEFDYFENGIKRRLNNPIFFNIPIQQERMELSTVFAMAPGYRSLYKYYLMLKRGLSIQGGCFQMSLKNVSQLYEYWCFIKLNHLLRERYRLVSQDFVKLQCNGLFVTLVKNGSSTMSYVDPDRPNEEITLAYNKSYQRSLTHTVSQKPDNVLSLSKIDKWNGNQHFRFVFDSKYRIDPAVEGTDYALTYGSPGPTEDDINTMHRYRDSIIDENGLNGRGERLNFGAYVLFPYHDEKTYVNHPFYQSIGSVNIGGLPFLPSTTHLVETLLDNLIQESPESSFERGSLPFGIEEHLRKVDWNRRDVLVGCLSKPQQLMICLKNRAYWIPISVLTDPQSPIHYVALYQSDTLFPNNSGVFYYGEVVTASFVHRDAIKIAPRASRDLYLYFKVEKWISLSAPVQVKEKAQTNIRTNIFLLHHAETYPELEIKTAEEFRLMYELKRIVRQWKIDDSDPSKLQFSYRGSSVFVKDEMICLSDGKGIYRLIPVSMFSKAPSQTLKNIQTSVLEH